ncbi:ketopantoate reductase family protein [Rhodohalobacter sp. 614A]|uniref:ketopantoate reductase family protein n=1 Tax=Rhodohalobacter sp. 614A TaxID=2908649 RepID=UPI001F3C0AA5|nr:2-dehydropantoate 2-reductase [Rhodohalobacter sp. 614A]
MKNPAIYIIGSGAIGKALAVFLKLENRDAILVRGSVDHQPEEENTITVYGQDDQVSRQTVKTTTFSHLSDINGIVLITAKAFGNTAIAEKLRHKEGDFSIVLLQNGLNIERPFDDFEKVYRCVLFSTSQVTGTHEVSFKTVTESPVGNLEGDNAGTEEIIQQIHTSYFGFRSEPNIETIVWNKAIINCAFNSICPLLEIDNGIFQRNTEAFEMAQTIIGECVAVAEKYDIKLDQKEIEQTLLLISQRADGQLISTYEDIRNKRRTEIESLNLEVARMADEINMPELVPTTRTLGEMIRIKSNLKMARN